jgi:hypothetical protein
MYQSMPTQWILWIVDNDAHAAIALSLSLSGLDIKHKHDGEDQINHSKF